MPDRVDSELRRVSTALAAVSPPKPDLPRPAKARRRPQVLAAVASFIVVLGLGLAAGLLFGPTEELPASGIVPVPEGHAANEILALDASPNEIPDLAVDLGFDFSCGEGQGVASCAIWEEGVAVVLPFRAPDGAVAEVSTPSHDGRLEIDFEVGEPVAVVHESGRFTVLHRVPGYETPFSYASHFPPSSGP